MEERFTVEINHGGVFCGQGRDKTYANCRTDHFDNCEVETWVIFVDPRFCAGAWD
jgi:hypothetical protein